MTTTVGVSIADIVSDNTHSRIVKPNIIAVDENETNEWFQCANEFLISIKLNAKKENISL